jgi:hypothetical protein
MTAKICIATASQDLFDSLRLTLARDEIGLTAIGTDRLPDAQAARAWLDSRDRTLLILDSDLPPTTGGNEDRSNGTHARDLLKQVRRSGITTPILVIMQGCLLDLEADCNPDNRAIALPLEKLQRFQAEILKPFLAMLMPPEDKTDNKPEIPGTFRVIEVDFCRDRSTCSLGYDDKPTLLEWEQTKQLRSVRLAARVFSNMDVYSQRGWIDKVRMGGEAVFGSHVMDAIGTGLFAHIERAAGGLKRLSFRYVITDPELYPAPFEGSVRGREDSQDGPFVLLSAPVVRRLAAPAVIGVSRHRTAELPPKARVLFIRSQMSEHPEGATEDDQLTVRDMPKPLSFRRLDSIDVELNDMKTLAKAVGSDRMEFEPLNLSDFQTEGARECLRRKLSRDKYDLVHYAGHAWSSGFSGREANLLVLPGPKLGEAAGFPIDEFAELAAEAEARFVYLSACRGSTTRSVQSFVAQGVPHALGFRCNVEDARAAAFAGAFYSSLFESRSLCRSFHAACAAARRCLDTDEQSPIWITPIMLAQTADWAMRV